VFDKILIANRGEIAVRIARTCRDLGVRTVAVCSDADARSRHRAVADEAVALPGSAPADTYLNAGALIRAALDTGAPAVHPGYGFLSESADFAAAVSDAGLTWIGPPPEAMRAVGDKVAARRIALEAGVPVVPGTLEPLRSVDGLHAFAAEHGYPVAVKAAGGGGGRGVRVVRGPEDAESAFRAARREAHAYFGTADVYLERYFEGPKHLEVQIVAPGPDEALWLGVRDCSLQRRHQKLIEETPPPGARGIAEMGEAAVALSKACGYAGAGTVELLVDRDGSFFFLEVNARLQVEHTVTEEVYGVDLVACQLRIAAGDPLGFTQADLEPRGHAIECRINAEDPARGFAPSPGTIGRYVEPHGLGVRVDSGYAGGDEVPGAYDSLVAKVVTWGATREEARRRMLRALGETVIEGVATTIPAHRLLLESEVFQAGEHSTTTVEASGILDDLDIAPDVASGRRSVIVVAGQPVSLWAPAMAAAAAGVSAGPTGEVVAAMQGTVVEVRVAVGDVVEAGDPVMVLEAMKMETTLVAPRSGRVTALDVRPGDGAEAGRVLARIE
jgi:acetyl-CoA/propionyl-CoA carboxylase, biotin carboxylase, biotin carboxyl carrier protein